MTEERNDVKIPASPKQPYDREAAGKVLRVARSYLDRTDRLVYSFGSRTFLSGYDVCGADGRGFIDCSTFIVLVLAGIPYEESPYASGTAEGLRARPGFGADAGHEGYSVLFDFSDLSEKFIGIAERIGRPYLEGPKGLDLKKAAELGIGMDTLRVEIRAAGGGRRSEQLARYFLEQGACFSDPACRKPGDLAFYLSSGKFTEGEMSFPAERQVNHVGIVSEETGLMINSTGLSGDGAPWKNAGLPGVSVTSVFHEREPAFFARPRYGAV